MIAEPRASNAMFASGGWNPFTEILHCLVPTQSGEIFAADQGNLVLSDAQRRTVYALSTPPGKGGIAVVRVSGPDVLEVWKSMVKTREDKNKGKGTGPIPWKMHRCRVVQPGRDDTLDDGLAVFFRAPNSFTTEDVLELHIHSGRAIISSVLAALSRLPYCRPAGPGEFTRRAFEGGRLDLTQVEGIKDLIDAETEGQRRIALEAAGGSIRNQFEDLRSEIIRCLALVEALIDFGEGEDIEDGVYEQARERAQRLLHTIQSHLQDNRRGELIRSGIRLSIFGPPNAGRREAAIVTAIPGTTRDILELSLDIGGIPVIVADTAGLRKTSDVVERIGIERAKKAVQGSHISLCVLSLPEVLVETPQGPRIEFPQSVKSLITPDTFFLLNKSDLIPSSIIQDAIHDLAHRTAWSASLTTFQRTSEFLSGFTRALQTKFEFHDHSTSQTPLITRARHRVHLESAARFLQAFLQTAPQDVVLGAEELRYAAQAVGKVSGIIDVEDVLDAVFRDFCIGK
ncbi:tRNA modification GTPase TrmE [Infundibulicybe gibba]|nr:tRNA modification GTPase TrmE [Infundibulicybe gibba]